MTSMKEIVSSSRKLTRLRRGDFIYVHPRSSHSDNSCSNKLSYFGRFRGYADEENFYEVDFDVDIKFGYERGKGDEKDVWLPRRIIRDKDVIVRVNTLEDNGYFLFAGERAIERGMRVNRNPNYDLVSDILHDSLRCSTHGSQRRVRDKIKYA